MDQVLVSSATADALDSLVLGMQDEHLEEADPAKSYDEVVASLQRASKKQILDILRKQHGLSLSQEVKTLWGRADTSLESVRDAAAKRLKDLFYGKEARMATKKIGVGTTRHGELPALLTMETLRAQKQAIMIVQQYQDLARTYCEEALEEIFDLMDAGAKAPRTREIQFQYNLADKLDVEEVAFALSVDLDINQGFTELKNRCERGAHALQFILPDCTLWSPVDAFSERTASGCSSKCF
tara:strand:- start:242 stop:961 length:720 start_codon:yes stop_codon:yes gene_type:complete